jgi:hypothetical protein
METLAGLYLRDGVPDLLLEPPGQPGIALSQLVDQECDFRHG